MDATRFRYPDANMLLKKHLLSNREFEIIKLIVSGLNSEQIAAKLNLSRYTINTHRRNILRKSGSIHLSELAFSLQEQGLI
jgi:DNA-binding CsgD family transcriptional regulator